MANRSWAKFARLPAPYSPLASMPNKRLLLQWIGHSDLRAMAISLPAAQREEILAEVKGPVPQSGDVGPTKTLLDTQSFDEICLLSNYRAEWNKLYLDWLGGKAKLVRVDLKKPTDYVSIFRIADAELAKVRKRTDWADIELCLHLSPGTPAMADVWLLLGKTRYPATFYETFAGRSWVTEIPFDLTIDVTSRTSAKPRPAASPFGGREPRRDSWLRADRGRLPDPASCRNFCSKAIRTRGPAKSRKSLQNAAGTPLLPPACLII